MQASFYEYLQNPKICELFLCKDEKQADLLAQVSRFKGLKTFVLPDFRAQFGDDLRAFSKELFDLCKILNAYHIQFSAFKLRTILGCVAHSRAMMLCFKFSLF